MDHNLPPEITPFGTPLIDFKPVAWQMIVWLIIGFVMLGLGIYGIYPLYLSFRSFSLSTLIGLVIDLVLIVGGLGQIVSILENLGHRYLVYPDRLVVLKWNRPQYILEKSQIETITHSITHISGGRGSRGTDFLEYSVNLPDQKTLSLPQQELGDETIRLARAIENLCLSHRLPQLLRDYENGAVLTSGKFAFGRDLGFQSEKEVYSMDKVRGIAWLEKEQTLYLHYQDQKKGPQNWVPWLKIDDPKAPEAFLLIGLATEVARRENRLEKLTRSANLLNS